MKQSNLLDIVRNYCVKIELMNDSDLLGECYCTLENLVDDILIEQKNVNFFRDIYFLYDENKEKIGVFEFTICIYTI